MPKIKGAVVINTGRCTGCNLCVVTCPTHCLALTSKQVNHKGYKFCEVTNPDACIGCASCAIVCPDACIAVYKKKIEQA